MARVRDLLYRFRPAGAPGAASASGVPADRAADLNVELEPLFAALASTEHECAAIVKAAERDAAAIRARDAERAQAIVASARSRAAAERASASANIRERTAIRSGRDLAGVEREAAQFRQRAADRLPPLVGAVLDRTRALVDAEPDQPRVGVT
jgi:hypothetical protein